MSAARVLVVSPILFLRRTVFLENTDAPFLLAVRSRQELLDGPLEAVVGARAAGADVLFLALADPELHAAIQARVENAGARATLLPCAGAAVLYSTYVGPDGTERLKVQESQLPSQGDVDRLLDALGREVVRGASSVVVAGDLSGARRLDFAERAVGRAWGFGVRAFTSVSGPSLKQAFHTQPAGAILPLAELQSASPPDRPDIKETVAETLARIFLDPVRILLLREPDGRLRAAVRGAEETLAPPDTASDGFLVGALAGAIATGPEGWTDPLAAARASVGLAARARPHAAAPHAS